MLNAAIFQGQPDLPVAAPDAGHPGRPPNLRAQFACPGGQELLDTALRQIEDVGEIGIEPVEADGSAL
jgi:hypothetical protein